MIWLIGIDAVLFGILLIIVGFKARGMRSKLDAAAEAIRQR